MLFTIQFNRKTKKYNKNSELLFLLARENRSSFNPIQARMNQVQCSIPKKRKICQMENELESSLLIQDPIVSFPIKRVKPNNALGATVAATATVVVENCTVLSNIQPIEMKRRAIEPCQIDDDDDDDDLLDEHVESNSSNSKLDLEYEVEEYVLVKGALPVSFSISSLL